MRLRRPIPALPAIAAGTMALLAAVFVPLLPTYAQGNAGPCSNGTAVPDPANNPGLVSDCEALLSARGSLDPGGSLNWSAATPIDQWDGVTVGDTSQRVTELSLPERQLTGKVAPKLGRLSGLRVLDLLGNGLSGNMPREMARLASLRSLSLSNNRLSGEIPSELGNLTELITLDLAFNRLSGPIPPELGRLSHLTRLKLDHNQLTGEIPSELLGLSNLSWLFLGNNHLTGRIPPDLGRIARLSLLDLGTNQFTGPIPPELGRLTGLVRLDLDQNRLDGQIPPQLGSLSDLDILRLSGNQLTGQIPPELAGLSMLDWLLLSHNQLTGEIPSGLGRLASLTLLDLGGNRLTGQIPPELGDLSQLGGLSLHSNKLTGGIPAELGRLSKLHSLSLDGNRLSGPIPPELRGLTNVVVVELRNNELSGEIPSTLGSLVNLEALYLSNNRLIGEIPAELGTLPNLDLVNLSGNKLIGCVPGRLRAAETNDLSRLGLPFCDVLLDDLVVSPGALAPSFDRYHPDYSTEVTTPIVTVLAISRHDATLHVLGEDGRELADADDTAAGIQIGTGTAFTGVTIRVVAADSEATHTYTIRIRRVLGAPTIAAVEAGGGYLAVSWAAPDEFAAARTASYDLRYIPTAADETVDANWTVVTNVPTDSADGELQYTITGLGAGTQYEVQVRAVDRSGDPVAWSASVTGTPTTPSACVTGGAVTGAINPGIVSNCESLLAARDALAGTGRLNWSASTAIKDWDGVTVGGTPPRVVGLSVNSRGLNGTIPAELGDLTGLRRLHLFENRLTGPIPAELGRLADLQALDLSDNRLTGQIPAHLARLSDLRSLDLSNNELAGVIPFQWGDLDNLVEVDLSGNELRGCTPPIPDQRGGPQCFADEGMTLTLDTSFLLRDDQLRVTSVGDASNGVVTLDGTTVTYRHDGSETTTGGFSYTASDGARTVTSLVTITVSPVNDPPAGETDALIVQEGGTVSVEARELLANDTDAEGDTLDITAVGDATNGLVALDGSTVFYRHDGSETNSGSFTYTLTDGAESVTASVTITVSPVNDPPTGVDDALAVREGGTVSVASLQLLANDTDAEGDALRISAVGGAVNGLVTLDGNTIAYTHDGSETVTGSFTYTVGDGTDSTTAFVTITVSPINDPPTGVDDALAVREGGTVSVAAQQLLANDTDAEGDALGITAVGDAINGAVTLDGNTIAYTHDGSETLTGSFTYTVSDGTDSTTAFVTITVSPINDPPVGIGDALAVQEGGTVSVAALQLLANDTDVEGDALRISTVGGAINGLVTLDGNTIAYTHDGSETLTGSFTYTVADRTDSATVLVRVAVSPVDDLPVLLLVTVALGAGLLVVGAVAAFAVKRARRTAKDGPDTASPD